MHSPHVSLELGLAFQVYLSYEHFLVTGTPWNHTARIRRFDCTAIQRYPHFTSSMETSSDFEIANLH